MTESGIRNSLSRQTIRAMAEVISGGSASNTDPSIGIYRRGWEIERFFKASDILTNGGRYHGWDLLSNAWK
jgi:hypothetical protein